VDDLGDHVLVKIPASMTDGTQLNTVANDDLGDLVADLIHRLMAKEPRDRIQNAAKLEEVLDEVEVECESKSEVAQAINQLQAGLNKVVKSKEPARPPAPTPVHAPNPFDALPDSIPAAPIANDPLGPVQTPPSGTFGATVKKPAPKNESSPMAMWIAIGLIAAGLLIVLPVAVFWGTSNSIDRQNQVDQAAVENNIAGVGDRPGQSNKIRQNRPSGRNTQQGSGTAVSLLNDPPAIVRHGEKAKQFNVPGAKWVIGAKQANGSFETTRPSVDTDRIPSWTVRRSGNDAGWRIVPNAIADLGVVAAFVGERSEIQLTGDPIKYRAKANDVFRLGANIGGEQKGITDYRVVLGFASDDGTLTRYEIAKVADPAIWGTEKKSRRLRYMYKATAEDAGKRPFLEFTMSTKNRGRKGRSFLDRAVLTVAPAGGASTVSVAAAAQAQPKSERPRTQPAGSANLANGKQQPRVSSNSQSQSVKNQPRGRAADASARSTPTSLREARLSTSDQLGADVTVKRGSGREMLGEQPRIAVQSRNGKQLQHAYLRFNLGPLKEQGTAGQRPNAGFGGKRGGKTVKATTAMLQLTLAGSERPTNARLMIYGLGDERSNIWPENRLNWSNSISASGLNELPLLAEVTVGEGDSVEPLVVSVSSPKLAGFISSIQQPTFTLVVAGENGNEPVYFAAKEDSRRQAPLIRLKIQE
ncbi:MAG: hypothetical protein AAFU85_18260, partial [Planctomycetota bacterium]